MTDFARKGNPYWSRRRFLLTAASVAGAFSLASCLPKQGELVAPTSQPLASATRGEPAQPETPTSAAPGLPASSATPSPAATSTAQPIETVQPNEIGARVLHVRHAGVTRWDGSGQSRFYDAVDQTAVTAMIWEGLSQLTGQPTWSAIWASIFTRVRPGGYQPGQKIAIKVNFNNSDLEPNNSASHDNNLDALPQPVVGLLTGMAEAGIDPADVVCYDATGREGSSQAGRTIPAYFRAKIAAAFPQVKFIGREESGVTAATHGKDSSLAVAFNALGGELKNRLLADVLYDAAYLINMPLLKCHSGNDNIPLTLGFKNHCGSIHYVYASLASDSLHTYIATANPNYSSNYSPLVDIYNNPHIKAKTVLTLGDGLYGAMWGNIAEVSWNTFGAPANSLFFSHDPVAIDCVMADLLRAESLARGSGGFTTPRGYDPLFCAQTAGLGVCEGTPDNPGGNPWQTPYGSGYSRIEYIRREIS
jgi:hypothetical protein